MDIFNIGKELKNRKNDFADRVDEYIFRMIGFFIKDQYRKSIKHFYRINDDVKVDNLKQL